MFIYLKFFSIHRMDMIEVFKRFEWPAYGLSVIFAISMLLTYHTSVFSSLMLCFRITGSIAVFCLASRILSTTSRRLPSLVCDSTYFIYLAHYVFFFSFIDTAFFAIIGTSIPALSIHYLLAPLLKAILLCIIYIVYRKLIQHHIYFN